ncbi:MAG: hypothetical protein Q9162_001352 [Coniocarpon cinnabarinum]
MTAAACQCRAERKTLLGLPDDVLTLIVKELNELAISRLYADMKLLVGSEEDHQITQLLDSHNPGLKHIRSLTAVFDSEDNENNIGQAQVTLGMMLQMLPRNSLETFSWRSWTPLSKKNLELLYRNQRKITNMEVVATDYEIDEAMISRLSLDDMAKNGKTLNFLFNSKYALEFANQLIRRCPRPLKQLMIITNFKAKYYSAEENYGEGHLPLQDSADRHGRIFSTMFRRSLGEDDFLDASEPLQVETIILTGVSLHKATSWFTKLDGSALQTLKLEMCDAAPKALSELCRIGTGGLRLKEISISHCESANGGDIRGTLEALLNVVQGLESLSVNLCCSPNLISIQSICRHEATLKTLKICCTSGTREEKDEDQKGWLYFTPENFQYITKRLRNVEHLVVPYIKCQITDGFDKEEMKQMFDALTGSESNLDNLHSLQLLTRPTQQDLPSPLPDGFLSQLLAMHAKKLFAAKNSKTKKLQRLQLVSWGTRDGGKKNLSIFTRGQQSALLGQPQLAAVPVSLGWVEEEYGEDTEIIQCAAHN